MIRHEIQDSDSSKEDEDSLVIKPPQTSSKVDSTFYHKEKKKRRHAREHKSNKKHHHRSHTNKISYEDQNWKVPYSDSSRRRYRNMESKLFYYKDNHGREQNQEFKKYMAVQEVTDMSHIRLMKDNKESKEEKKVIQHQEITNMRQIKLMKDVNESKKHDSKSKENDISFLEEKKLEWRRKRLLWIEQQRQQINELWSQKEKKLQEEIHQADQPNKDLQIEYSRIQEENYFVSSSTQEKMIKYHNVISPVSCSEEDMDYEESKQDKEKESDHISDKNDTNTESDISNSPIDIASGSGSHHSCINDDDDDDDSEDDDDDDDDIDDDNLSGENMQAGFNNTKKPSEVVVEGFQKETLPAEPAEKNKAVSVFQKESLPAKHIKEIGAVTDFQKKSSENSAETQAPKHPVYCPAIQGCRSIDGFHVLNRIEEGTYGVVYRARDKQTKEIVALKRLKMEREKEGFPITSLREINTLLKAQHPNIVTVREIVVGSNMDRIFIVMDYVEHDLKSLMKTMPRPFLIGEVKTLLLQLLCAVAHLHDNWILHRDLKTSNLLLSHKGILKVGDFGLAREYGSPLKSYTPVVVTLWYRAPELLLGAKLYSTPIDMWSVGCIFGELLTKTALFPGKSESDQINRIFKDLGTPSERIWPGYNELPLVKSMHITQYPYNNLKSRFSHTFTDLGFDLLNKFLTYNPTRRITAEKAQTHEYFNEKPKPVPPNMFPTWPAKSEQGHHKTNKTIHASPKPPSGGKQYSRQLGEADDGVIAGFHLSEAQHRHSDKASSFSLKF